MSRPDKSIDLKYRDSDTRLRFLSGWTNEDGRLAFKFSQDVAEIHMKDGTVVQPEDVWVNWKDWGSPNQQQARRQPGQTRAANKPAADRPDDDIPF